MKKVLFILMMVVSFSMLEAQVTTGSINNTSSSFHNYTFTSVAPTIRDYQVVESKDLKKLTMSVKVLMQQGWIPYGPVSVVYNELIKTIFYYQTMIKY